MSSLAFDLYDSAHVLDDKNIQDLQSLNNSLP